MRHFRHSWRFSEADPRVPAGVDLLVDFPSRPPSDLSSPKLPFDAGSIVSSTDASISGRLTVTRVVGRQ
jgi:hypothetical protein